MRRASSRAGGKKSAGTPAWRYWWEFNRDNLIGLRHLLDKNVVLTGDGEASRDALGARRDAVLTALRDNAGRRAGARSLRSAALVALGRIGESKDAVLFLRVLEDDRAPSSVQDSAALALGLLAHVDDASTRDAIRAAVRDRARLRTRTRGILTVSAGLRAREDTALRSQLASTIARGTKDKEDAAALLFACGLAGDVRTVPELMEAAVKARLGRSKLDDTTRSHAAMALGRVGDAAAAPVLLQVLGSRRAGVQTKRSAAMALGRMLREEQVDASVVPLARKSLQNLIRKKGDATLRGFAALAVAGAPSAQAIQDLERMLDGGRVELRPYAALALGIAARKAPADRARKIRRRLTLELDRCADPELAAALSYAVGLAGAEEALKSLLKRVERRALPADVRGAAAMGAGMLGHGSAKVEKVLLDALEDGPTEFVGEAALGLGLTGRRTVARVLIDRIPKARSTFSMGRMVLALGYLGNAGAVDPLLAVLGDERASPSARAQAAIALGLLGDPREDDALFSLGTDFNFLATSRATYEVLNQM